MLAPVQKESAQLQPKDSSHICRLCKLYCTSKPQNVLCYQPYSDTRATKPVGHDHNMSPASSQADSFQSKLAGYHPGSLGATSHSGLLPRSLSLPYAVKGTLRDTPPTKRESSGLTRDIETARKRSHNPGSLKPARSYLSAFSGPQKGGGQRPVINLKALSRFIRWEYFQMEGLHMLPDVLETRDWLVKLDLKDAYLQVPIHPEHHKLLQFQWEGVIYNFQYLPSDYQLQEFSCRS